MRAPIARWRSGVEKEYEPRRHPYYSGRRRAQGRRSRERILTRSDRSPACPREPDRRNGHGDPLEGWAPQPLDFCMAASGLPVRDMCGRTRGRRSRAGAAKTATKDRASDFQACGASQQSTSRRTLCHQFRLERWPHQRNLFLALPAVGLQLRGVSAGRQPLRNRYAFRILSASATLVARKATWR